MTPHQLNIYIQEYEERKKLESEEKLILTYLGVYWNKVKRLPSLDKILGKQENEKKKNEKMSPEAILEEVKRLNEAMGGTVY